MIADMLSSVIRWTSPKTELARLPRNATIENPQFSLNDPAAFESMFSGPEASSGVKVNHASALSLGAVWQAVSTISGDVALAILNIMKTEADGDVVVDLEHDAQPLVSVQPNDEMSAFDFWRRLMVHACLWQNGYAFILRESRAPNGRMLAILNLLPDRTCAMRHDDGTLYYGSEVDGKMEPFRADEIIHVKGLSVDNSSGCDLVEKARESFGLALAAQGFGAKFFKNGAQAGGMLEIPATFTEKAKQNLEEGFDKKYAGPLNWFKTVILRDGAKFHANTIDAQKSQMHELREDQVRDTARFFNLPPFKLGLSDSVSYNSQEQGQIVYLTGCLNHWFGAIRGECNIKLLSANERMSGQWKCKHDVSPLIETDTKTHTDVLVAQIASEIICPDEARRELGKNKRPDGLGGVYQNPNTKAAPSGADGASETAKSTTDKPTEPFAMMREAIADLWACHGKGGEHGPCPTGRHKKRAKKQKPSAKALKAKAAHHMVDAPIQRYSEEHNEPRLAKKLGGKSEPDNKAYDVLIEAKGGGQAHGVELKTMVSNKANKLTMKGSAQDRKAAWEVENKATFHTVVYDDQKVYNAKGDGVHGSEKDRNIYYRRGGGSFRVDGMYKVKDHAELKNLIQMHDDALPKEAQSTSQWKARQAAAKGKK